MKSLLALCLALLISVGWAAPTIAAVADAPVAAVPAGQAPVAVRAAEVQTPAAASAADGAAPGLGGDLRLTSDPAKTSEAVRTALLLTLLALLPAVAICMTPFIRFVVVLSMIRHAFGMPETPPSQVLISLAIFLTAFTMLEDTGLYVSEGEADNRTSAYESVAWREAVQRLAGEVGSLPDREQLIIRRHYIHGMTFDQIGALLGLTKGRISQLHRAALALLKKRLRRAGDFRLER